MRLSYGRHGAGLRGDDRVLQRQGALRSVQEANRLRLDGRRPARCAHTNWEILELVGKAEQRFLRIRREERTSGGGGSEWMAGTASALRVRLRRGRVR